MARRKNNKRQHRRNSAGSVNVFDHTTTDQKTRCHVCGKYHAGRCRFANGNAAHHDIPGSLDVVSCPVCNKRHRGPCRWLANFNNRDSQNKPRNRTILRGTTFCRDCKRRHAGPCKAANNGRNLIRGRRQAKGHDVLLFPLRVVATRVRQYGGPDRVDTFIREDDSDDAVMCYCDGTTSFCVQLYAEQFAEQTKNNNLILTQSDEDGLRHSMWSNYSRHAFDDFVVAYSKGHSLIDNVDHTAVNPFRLESSEDVEML